MPLNVAHFPCGYGNRFSFSFLWSLGRWQTLAKCPNACAGATQRRFAGSYWFLCLEVENEPTAALVQHDVFAGQLGFWQGWTATLGAHNRCYVMRANSSALTLLLVWQSSLATLPFCRHQYLLQLVPDIST